MNVLSRLYFAYQVAVDWTTCRQLWWYTLLFSLAIRSSRVFSWLQQSQQAREYHCKFDEGVLHLHLRPQDLPIFYEIFQEQAYRFPQGINFSSEAKILDIGAHVGLFSCYCLHLFGNDVSIMAVEPSPHNFRLLKTNLAASSSVRFLPKAVSNQSGTGFMETGALSYNHRLNTTGQGQKVPTIDILELLAPYSPTNKLQLLKMDVEGQEAHLIPALATKKSCITYLVLELHTPYSAQQLEADLAIEPHQLVHLQASTYLINFAFDETS